ncbi:Sensor protein CreC [Clostridium sp. N3C]|uniref:sensor histidine kinase n=1 Tax=Clostridium sp. N3C TaxID=1776758 RepID=UPI00092E1C6A|nr:HAMP domain-containing sensor histidine kinase [Clostridium sp. N3C]SCN25021.1 Sensor protein CreC [Clostridium sp. N3C]
MGLISKNIRLRTFFVRYLLALFVGFLLIVLIIVGIFFISLKTGFIISVGEVEADIQSKRNEIASAKIVSEELIPETCQYAVLSKNGEFLLGSMAKLEADNAWKEIESGRRSSGIFLMNGLNPQCYFPIERQNEIVILKYSALTQFSSKFLRKHLPPPVILVFLIIFVSIPVEIILLSRFYARKISRKLIPLQIATEKIENKDLEFEVQFSGIQEIDIALQSLESMKTDLKRSLEMQWNIEQKRKMQISALAHDIKTPLTVVRGSAEMLKDTNQTEEQKEFINYILKNANQMEQYVQMLIELSKAEDGYIFKREKVNTRTFLDELYSKIHALVSIKNLKTEFQEKNLPEIMNIDSSLMQRAIMNITSNAVDYTPEGGVIKFYALAENYRFQFIVEDSGKGFSTEDLKKAKMQFYQGDSSRSSKSHYGMGLFIADSIVRQHGGSLSLANTEKGGARVTIEF